MPAERDVLAVRDRVEDFPDCRHLIVPRERIRAWLGVCRLQGIGARIVWPNWQSVGRAF